MYPAQQTARSCLKAETDDLHQKLHDLPVFKRLFDGSIELDEYILMMRCFCRFYNAFDPKLLKACNDFQNQLSGYAYEPRAEMFETDVLAFGKENCLMDTVFPNSAILPNIEDPAVCAGAIYVIDGSVLGGITMNKAVSTLLDADNPEGRTYWNWCRNEGVVQWYRALNCIEARWYYAGERSRIIASARHTFEALSEFLAVSDAPTTVQV